MAKPLRKLIQYFESQQPAVDAKKGEILFNHGDSTPGVLLVKSGKVQLRVACPIGSDIIRTAGGGDVLGVAPLFCGKAHHVTAEVVSKARVIFVDSETFLDYLDENPEMRIQVLKVLSADVSSCYALIRGGMEMMTGRGVSRDH